MAGYSIEGICRIALVILGVLFTMFSLYKTVLKDGMAQKGVKKV